MANIRIGYEFLPKLCEALKITGPVRRVIIDAAIDEAVTVYVQRYLDDAEGEPLVAALSSLDESYMVECRELTVDEKGNVKAGG